MTERRRFTSVSKKKVVLVVLRRDKFIQKKQHLGGRLRQAMANKNSITITKWFINATLCFRKMNSPAGFAGSQSSHAMASP